MKKNGRIIQEPKYCLDNTVVGDSWRMFRIMAEFVDGFDAMSAITVPAVTIYGSARTAPDHHYYQIAEKIGYGLAKAGFCVISGGGPGIMEAANKGAAEAEGVSVGLNISLPHEEKHNRFANFRLNFKYFFVRKVMLMKYSTGFVAMPGGYGSMDELFEALTLIQTKRVKPVPVVLVGSEFWAGLVDWLQHTMGAAGNINPQDIDLFKVLDDADEVVDYLDKKISR